MSENVEKFFEKNGKWAEEMRLLREIVLQCNLNEDFKWMHPCYSLNEANIVLIHSFKEYCALLFFKGALMDDPKSILIQQTKNVQERRQIRFRNEEDIISQVEVIKAYLNEAIKVEREGRVFTYKDTAEFALPEEFDILLQQDPKLKEAFQRLTPGRQRGYLLYFSSAKQSKTRQNRIDKYLPKIYMGKGLED